MADKQTPPDWVFLEAAKRSGRTGSIEYLRRYYAFSTQADFRALCDMIERYEAFRQEVSDAVENVRRVVKPLAWDQAIGPLISRFIIAKPDPLEEVMNEMGFGMSKTASEEFRAALAARGLEVRKIGEGE